MAGTRLLVALSFAIPFVVLVCVSLALGIPHDDVLWKRLASLSMSAVGAPQLDPPTVDMMKAPRIQLLVPPSWIPNTIESMLYEVIPTKDVSVLCDDDKGEDSIRRQDQQKSDTIVLCLGPDHIQNVVESSNGNTILVYAASDTELRNMILSEDMNYPFSSPHIRLLFDRPDSSSDWKQPMDEIVDHVTNKWNPSVCHEGPITLELGLVDEDVRNLRSIMGSIMGTGNRPPTDQTAIVLYFTSAERAASISEATGGMEAFWQGDYAYVLSDATEAIAKLETGLQRILYHECWSMPRSTTLSMDALGMETFLRIYNATFTRRMEHLLRAEAAMLQHRMDHLQHSTAEVIHGEKIAQSLRLLAQGMLGPANQALDSVRFRMAPDFPWDQYAAIFAPLLFPLLLPVIFTTVKEWKRYRKQVASVA